MTEQGTPERPAHVHRGACKCSESLQFQPPLAWSWLLACRLQLDPDASASQVPSRIAEPGNDSARSKVEGVLLETRRELDAGQHGSTNVDALR